MDKNELKKKKEKEEREKEQILIEDGTLATFGFSNPSEVTVQR